MPPTTQPHPLTDLAIIVHEDDNVAVVSQELATGAGILLPSGNAIVLSDDLAPGHRIAIDDVPIGQFMIQYGHPIGTSLGIKAGDIVSIRNMSNDVPVVREVPADLFNPAPDYLPDDQIPTFAGFRRPDGRVGTRNFILIVPTSMCASHEAQQIAMMAEFQHYSRSRFPNVDGVVAIPHNKGCGCQSGSNLEVMLRTLANYAAHPNVGGVVLMDLGCEKTNLPVVEEFMQRTLGGLTKPTAKIGIQDVGGTANAIHIGMEAVREMLPIVNRTEREPVSISELVLGVKCGGSDGLSGLSANPSLGAAADLLIRSHGTVLMTEVPEFCGGEHILALRAKDATTARAIYSLVDWYKDYARSVGSELNDNPAPGNIAGGLTNITIKSLGAITKAGTTRVEGVTEYAEAPRGRGLFLMQGPGYDQESTPGLVAAGATVVVFTTGRGTTIGNAICPVIKLASNNAIFHRMISDIDLSAGDVIERKESCTQAGARIFRHIQKVSSGDLLAKAETHKHREFGIWAERAIAL